MAHLKAPWTPEQVVALNRFQHNQFVHPFTCGRRGEPDAPLHEAGEVLVATTAGWVCQVPGCGYTQDWAHDFMLQPFNPGATGRFPFGRLGQDDEGELAVAIAADHRHGVVRFEFGKPVGWLALGAAQARSLGQMLIQKADELDRRKS